MRQIGRRKEAAPSKAHQIGARLYEIGSRRLTRQASPLHKIQVHGQER